MLKKRTILITMMKIKTKRTKSKKKTLNNLSSSCSNSKNRCKVQGLG